MQIDKKLISELLDKALSNPRLREGYDLCASSEKGNQCIFNTFILGTIVPIHRHPNSNEYSFVESSLQYYTLKRAMEYAHLLDSTVGKFGCILAICAQYFVEVLEPFILYEAKYGEYGGGVSEIPEGYNAKKDFLVSGQFLN